MVATTTVSKRLETKPVVASERGYVTFDGVSTAPVSVSDSAALDITGDISVIVRARLDDWTPSAKQTIVSKLTTTGNQRSWALSITTSGLIELLWSTNGAPIPLPFTSLSAPTPDADGWCWLAAVLDVYRPDIDAWHLMFYESVDGETWKSLGGWYDTGATSIFDSTAPLVIGSVNSGTTQRLDGSVDYVSVRAGVTTPSNGVPLPGGDEVFRFDGAAITSSTQTTIPTATGQTITRHVNAALAPAVLRGMPTGAGDWRLVIERLRGSGAVVGEAVVGTAVVGSLVWEDITQYYRGHQARRGAQERLGRPMNGEIILTLDARTNDSFDPYTDATNTRPGTIVRCAWVSALDTRADGWLPRWTGLVETWPPVYVQGADRYVEVKLIETLSSISLIDDNALPGVVGNGERVTARIDRLLTQAGWRFGMVTLFDSGGESAITLQSTQMALNRSAEVYLTADSTNAVVRSDVTGAALVTHRNNNLPSRLAEFSTFLGAPCVVLTKGNDNTSGGTWSIAYDHDSVITDTSPLALVNDHRYARAGGTTQVFEHKVSQGVFRQKRTRKRTDLLCQLDAQALAVAQADSDREARTTLDIAAITVTATGKPDRLLASAALDIGDLLWIFPPAAEGFSGSVLGRVRSIIEDVRPLYGRVAMSTTYAVDITQINGVAGAMLAPAPR